ncbi:MAG: hypothetical protein AB7O96_18250 [Pseudobdellovibrionaceae bacterium]
MKKFLLLLLIPPFVWTFSVEFLFPFQLRSHLERLQTECICQISVGKINFALFSPQTLELHELELNGQVDNQDVWVTIPLARSKVLIKSLFAKNLTLSNFQIDSPKIQISDSEKSEPSRFASVIAETGALTSNKGILTVQSRAQKPVSLELADGQIKIFSGTNPTFDLAWKGRMNEVFFEAQSRFNSDGLVNEWTLEGRRSPGAIGDDQRPRLPTQEELSPKERRKMLRQDEEKAWTQFRIRANRDLVTVDKKSRRRTSGSLIRRETGEGHFSLAARALNSLREN